MRSVATVACAIAMAGCFGDAARSAGQPEASIRPPAVAGQFYPDDPVKLRAAIDGFMRDAVPATVDAPVAIVVPHAGYIFSGQIAADGYRQVAGRDVDTVVILGTNHTSGTFRRVSVYDGAGYRTPLGVADVDQELAAALVKDGGAVFDRSLHTGEHSVEVQVPFVQVLFPKAKIVPVVVGAPDDESCSRFGRALAQLGKGRRLLIVASSDLSHYPPFREAVEVDRSTLAGIESMDPSRLSRVMAQASERQHPGLATCACGEGPIRVAMEAARGLGATRGFIVAYANSGDTVMGDRDRVVGYGAVAFGRGAGTVEGSAVARLDPDASGSLGVDDKRVLLRLARETVTRYLTTDTLPLPRRGSPKLLREAGTFVTWTKHGELRGCIGSLEPAGTLIRLVSSMALEAAFKDPRFPPITAGELKDLQVEVSVLTPMKPVAGPDAIVVGRDGVVLRVGERAAVFLPQVAPEQGWSRTEMLDHLAEKAGLPASAWRDARAKFLTFQADVFGEASLK